MCPPSSSPPNVVLVVMDCVRADEFPPHPHGGPGLPCFERLRAESIAFPQTVAPSPWTLPSHASLFTGLYPWEHGLHGRGDYRLSPSIPTLAELLQRQGYRTLCFSANSHITESSGLTRGFAHAWQGNPIDLYLRFGASRPADAERSEEENSDDHVFRIPGDSEHGERTRSVLSRLLEDPPLFWDVANRVGRKVLGGTGRSRGTVSPWLEASFDEALRKGSGDAPVFAFFNFLDAHEPYPIDSCHGNPLDWLRAGLVPQSRRRWAAGKWRPTKPQLETIRELYRHAVARLDQRIGRLIATLEARGLWENTLLILTSDHGQAFGEGGALFHELSLDESVSRVPLWVRFPGGEHAGTDARGWASLIDIAPTITAGVDGSPSWNTSGRNLSSLIESDRPDPVYTSAEGLLWNHWPGLSPSRRSQLDRIRVAAYFESSRFELDAESGVLVERIGSVPTHSRAEPEDLSATRRAELSRYLVDAADRIRTAPFVPLSDSVSERMTAWGY